MSGTTAIATPQHRVSHHDGDCDTFLRNLSRSNYLRPRSSGSHEEAPQQDPYQLAWYKAQAQCGPNQNLRVVLGYNESQCCELAFVRSYDPTEKTVHILTRGGLTIFVPWQFVLAYF